MILGKIFDNPTTKISAKPMRIRKRQVPLPLSSLTPVPLSDPPLNRTPVVQLHHNSNISPPKASDPPQNLSHGGDTARHVSLRPSDQTNQHPSPIGAGSNGWNSVDDASGAPPNKNNGLEKKLQRVEDDGDEEGEKRNDSRDRSIFGAEARNGFLPESSSSGQVVGRWCEREKAFPLKKRRGNFEGRENEEITVSLSEKEKKMMKTKMNKKCTQKQEDEEEPKLGMDHVTSSTGGSGKKRSRGGALMEGSRCSRVNGRGWRCCQQTLVGYSLCEHHLGKGRLRSMNSVRSRSSSANNAPKKEADGPPSEPLSSQSSPPSQRRDQKQITESVEKEGEKKPLTLATKKRMKLGVVKARSISSLLGQTDNVMAAAAPPPDDHINK